MLQDVFINLSTDIILHSTLFSFILVLYLFSFCWVIVYSVYWYYAVPFSALCFLQCFDAIDFMTGGHPVYKKPMLLIRRDSFGWGAETPSRTLKKWPFKCCASVLVLGISMEYCLISRSASWWYAVRWARSETSILCRPLSSSSYRQMPTSSRSVSLFSLVCLFFSVCVRLLCLNAVSQATDTSHDTQIVKVCFLDTWPELEEAWTIRAIELSLKATKVPYFCVASSWGSCDIHCMMQALVALEPGTRFTNFKLLRIFLRWSSDCIKCDKNNYTFYKLIFERWPLLSTHKIFTKSYEQITTRLKTWDWISLQIAPS